MSDFDCANCDGLCCMPPAIALGPEIDRILDYVAEHNIPILDHQNPVENNPHCGFYDRSRHRCLIYPLRPLYCRLRGYTMEFPCYKDFSVVRTQGAKAEAIQRYSRAWNAYRAGFKNIQLTLDAPLIRAEIKKRADRANALRDGRRFCKNCGRELIETWEVGECRLCKPRKIIEV